MNIEKTLKDDTLCLAISGRLDTNTAPALEAELKDLPEEVRELILDFAELEYISSAGLRVLLSSQKAMRKKGRMVIRYANEDVMDVFDVTGLVDVLNIEDSADPSGD